MTISKFHMILIILTTFIMPSCGRQKPTVSFLSLDVRQSANGENYIQAIIATNAYVLKKTSIEISCAVAPTGTQFIWTSKNLSADKTFVFDSKDTTTTKFKIKNVFASSGELFKGSGIVTCSLIDNKELQNLKIEHSTKQTNLTN